MESVKRKIELCNDLLKEECHPIALVNIETEKIISYSAIIIGSIFTIVKAIIH